MRFVAIRASSEDCIIKLKEDSSPFHCVIRTNGEAAAGMFDIRIRCFKSGGFKCSKFQKEGSLVMAGYGKLIEPNRRIVAPKLTKKAILSVTVSERAENVEFRIYGKMNCKPCMANMAECPGHFRRLELVKPMVHIGFMKTEDYKFKQALKIENPKKQGEQESRFLQEQNHRLLLNHLRENKSFMQKRFKKLITENSRN
nr:DNA-directed RNA polymerase II subunit 1 [Tanacetum cinerariifolium]